MLSLISHSCRQLRKVNWDQKKYVKGTKWLTENKQIIPDMAFGSEYLLVLYSPRRFRGRHPFNMNILTFAGPSGRTETTTQHARQLVYLLVVVLRPGNTSKLCVFVCVLSFIAHHNGFPSLPCHHP